MSAPKGAVTRGRLIFFAPSPSEPGGAEKRTRLLASALADRGWETLVVGRTTGRSGFRSYQRGSLRVLEVPGFGRRRLGATCFMACALLVGLLSGPRTSGFLALQLSSPATAAALCGLALRRPFLIIGSTAGSLSETSLLRHGRGATARRSLLSGAAALVAQTETAASELAAVLPSTPITVVPNPVIASGSPPLSQSPRVAFAGRFSEEKDLPGLLEAWESLLTERPDAQLTLIGSGRDHRSVEAQLRAEIENRPALRATVRLTGWLEDPSAELSSADVFVLPSLSEGMSNALLEACALGRVVVASDIPANVSVLGTDYPLLFPAGNRSRLKSALRQALGDDALRASCRARVVNRIHKFSPTLVAEQLEALLFDADRARHQ